MSCFERSVFLQNAEHVDRNLLVQTCEKLEWRWEDHRGELWVFPKGVDRYLFGAESVLTVSGNTITWNTYFMQNGKELADELRNAMRVEYARTTILSAFKKIGFHFLEDLHFTANAEEKHRFYMKGESKLRDETEKTAKIRFTILSDGTVRTDSDYIPEDIHVLADKAMGELEAAFGNRRSISPKEIPAKYLNKAFCHRKDVIQLRQGKQ